MTRNKEDVIKELRGIYRERELIYDMENWKGNSQETENRLRELYEKERLLQKEIEEILRGQRQGE